MDLIKFNIFYSFFKSKIDTYKIKNQINNGAIEKKKPNVSWLIIKNIKLLDWKKRTRKTDKKYNCGG